MTNAAYQHEPRINEVVYEIVQRHGGTISAEHGIGQLKRDLLPQYRSDVELDLMRTIKHALDPHKLMNPGKLLAVEHSRTDCLCRRQAHKASGGPCNPTQAHHHADDFHRI